MWTQANRIEILQRWCAARTTHRDSGYDVTITIYLLPDFYLKWKTPYLLLQSLTEFLAFVLCNLRIRSHALNEQQEQLTHFDSDFTFWMERAWSLFLHSNDSADIIIMELCYECNNCSKFQFYTEKVFRDIFVILCHFCVHIITSQVI